MIAAIKDNLLHLQAKLQDPTQDRLREHRTGIELALEASLPPSDSSSSSSSDDSVDNKTHGVDFETLAVGLHLYPAQLFNLCCWDILVFATKSQGKGLIILQKVLLPCHTSGGVLVPCWVYVNANATPAAARTL